LLGGGEPSPRQWVTGGIRGEVSIFNGRWRLNAKSRHVIDAQQLPRETVVAGDQLEANASIQRLQAVAKKILSANSIGP